MAVNLVIAAIGYLIAAAVATVSTILVMLAPALLPIEGYWGAVGVSFDDIALGALFGFITTVPSALPGFAVTFLLAARRRWSSAKPFAAAGAVNGAASVFLFATVMTRGSPDAVFIGCCVVGGLFGGLVYWWVAGRFIAARQTAVIT